MTIVMKASGSAEFLGLVPALAGFTPTRSVVLVPFENTRAYGALRMDLPDVDPFLFAERAVGLTARIERTDAVAVVVYCEEAALSTRDGLVLPHAVLVDSILGAAEDARLGIVDALCVTPDGWASYLDDDPCLHPLSSATPEVPTEAGAVEGDQNDGADLPDPGVIACERVGRALTELDRVLCRIRIGGSAHTGRESPQAITTAQLLEDIPELFESALDLPDDPPAFTCAALIWLLDQPLYRDVALLQWATDHPGGESALTAQLAYRDTGVLPTDRGGTMIGMGRRPDPRRLRAALRTVRIVAAHAPRAERTGPLAVAAWLSWALGRASHAEQYLAQIERIDPEYSFGRLLHQLMAARPLPDWAFDRRAA
jgi:hypothetical protein